MLKMAKEIQMEQSEKEVKIDIIEFEEDSLPLILDLFGNEITEDGGIVDQTLKEQIVDEFTDEQLNVKNFGGILASSRIFISKNNASLAEYINRYCKEK